MLDNRTERSEVKTIGYYPRTIEISKRSKSAEIWSRDQIWDGNQGYDDPKRRRSWNDNRTVRIEIKTIGYYPRTR